MNLLEHTKALLQPLVAPGDAIVCACSGGSDSMALLDLLVRLQKPLGINVIAAHLHHGLRGKAADRDEKTVQTYAKQRGIPCYSQRIHLRTVAAQQKQSLEEAGRHARNAFLQETAKKAGARFIAKAHHADDQIETILFNLARGAGLRGLAGMRMAQGNILRPLLEVPKKELQTYARQRQIPFHEDRTNTDTAFARNRLRKNVIPELRKVHPGFPRSLLKTARQIAALEAWMEQEAQTFLKKQNPGINIRRMQKLPQPLRRHIIQTVYRQTHGSAQGLSETVFHEVEQLMDEAKIGAHRAFGNHWEFVKKKNLLILKKTENRVH